MTTTERKPGASRIAARLAAGLCGSALVCLSLPAAAQVKSFDHVPTPDEIMASLAAPKNAAAAGTDAASGDATKERHTRGLKKRAPGEAAPAAADSNATLAQNTQAPAGPAISLPVNFDTGSAHITPASMGYIQAMASVLERDPSLRLVVEGHTDAVGNPRGNLMLSWDRAYAVFHVLVERYNVDPSRLQPLGKGSSEPLSGKDPADSENRRVQFRVAG